MFIKIIADNLSYYKTALYMLVNLCRKDTFVTSFVTFFFSQSCQCTIWRER